jgi:hypothetical protein
MKTTYKYAHLFLIFYFLFFGISCELFDEKTCDFSRDEVKDWYNGHLFDYEYDPPMSLFEDQGCVDKINLGPPSGMVNIDDICTSDPVIVSVALETKNGGLDDIYKAYLLISSEFDNQQWSYPRAITLARTDVGSGNNTLVVQNVEIPAFPNFHSDDYAGSIRMGISINIINRYCDEDEAHLVAENWLDYFIEKATITVSYTQY